MNIEPVEMTTPLNVEMMKQLKETLVAINESQQPIAIARASIDDIAQKDAAKKATTAVLRAITCFCSPMMRSEIPGENAVLSGGDREHQPDTK